MSSSTNRKLNRLSRPRFHPLLISKSGCQDSQDHTLVQRSHQFCVSRVPVGPQRGARGVREGRRTSGTYMGTCRNPLCMCMWRRITTLQVVLEALWGGF